MNPHKSYEGKFAAIQIKLYRIANLIFFLIGMLILGLFLMILENSRGRFIYVNTFAIRRSHWANTSHVKYLWVSIVLKLALIIPIMQFDVKGFERKQVLSNDDLLTVSILIFCLVQVSLFKESSKTMICIIRIRLFMATPS